VPAALQPLCTGEDDGVRAGAQREDDRVDDHLELRTLDGHRRAPARSIRLTQLHADAAHAGHVPLLVAENRHRVREEIEDHTFFDSVVELFLARRHLCARAPVDDVHVAMLGAIPVCGSVEHLQALGAARGVHGHVARTDDRHMAPRLDRGVIIWELVALHQVDAGQELVGRHHAVQIDARDAHERR